MRLLLGAKSMPFGCMSMERLGACMRLLGASLRLRLGAKHADVGCKSAETFGCMYAEVGCKFHNG